MDISVVPWSVASGRSRLSKVAAPAALTQFLGRRTDMLTGTIQGAALQQGIFFGLQPDCAGPLRGLEPKGGYCVTGQIGSGTHTARQPWAW